MFTILGKLENVPINILELSKLFYVIDDVFSGKDDPTEKLFYIFSQEIDTCNWMYQENDLNTIKFFKKTNSARSDTSYTSTAFDLKVIWWNTPNPAKVSNCRFMVVVSICQIYQNQINWL